MNTTRLLLEAVIHHSTILFRAPYNADSEPTTSEELRPIALSRDSGYYTVGESIDPNDWSGGTTADMIYSRIVEQYEKHPDKGIILLHDAGGDRNATIEALPRIIEYFKSKHIQFTTVAHLLRKTRDEIMPPIQTPLTEMSSIIAQFLFFGDRTISFLFLFALILGGARLTSIAGLAFWHFWKHGPHGMKK